MTKLLLLCISLTFLLAFVASTSNISVLKQHEPSSPSIVPPDDNGSDFKCTICVVVVTIIENEAGDNRKQIQEFLGKVCDYVPPNFNATCRLAVSLFGNLAIDLILKKERPSKICNLIPSMECNGCSLDALSEHVPVSDGDNAHDREVQRQALQRSAQLEAKAFLLSSLLYKNINLKKKQMDSLNQHGNKLGDPILPGYDVDKDYFSPTHNFIRGADWRGKDCNDTNPAVRPGLPTDANINEDSNCNGIFGANEQGQSYEKLYCDGTDRKMVLMFGDSGSSAFHIPPEWLHLQNISSLLHSLQDEFDYPQYSYSTGFAKEIDGESIFLKLRQRNLCNHRSYQNIGHNGARARDMAGYQIPQMAKIYTPVLALAAYIGNDVCTDRPEWMTKPEDFEQHLTNGITTLDKQVPPGSKLLYMGLVDGRILWNEMHDRIHPLGVSYKNVYNFLSCTKANPCSTWLTANETLRDVTSERAALLSQVAAKVVSTLKPQLVNLDIDYIDFPLQPAIEYCKQQGISPAVLIEPFDGFHPSHFGHRFFSRYIWDYIAQHHPDWLGAENPNNDLILKIFNDQGGF